jgi:tetratricopeptide (TPR) repeat protein
MRRYPAVLAWLMVVAASGQDRPQGDLTEAVVAFARAYAAWDASGLATACAAWEELARGQATNAEPAYWLGVTAFHHMLCLQQGGTGSQAGAAADTAWARAVEALNTVVRLAPNHAEAHALLATLHGMKIGSSRWRALRWGPLVQRHQKAALKHGADNPRVQYLRGVALFKTARDAAGLEAARKVLLLARELFEREAERPAAATTPRWGRGDCLAFLGLVEERLQRPEEAARWFREALRWHPGHRLAREGLSRLGRKD